MSSWRRFQDDLYCRLHVVPIFMPPLRDRAEDIPMLVHYLADKHATRNGKSIDAVEDGVVSQLQAYHWPGSSRALSYYLDKYPLIDKERARA